MNGVYGTVKPAYLTTNNILTDVDIYYSFRSDRSDEGTAFTKGDPSWLIPVKIDLGDDKSEIVPGAFNLQLPTEIFNSLGVYTIYIKPREVEATIMDVGVLSEYPDVRGLVFKTFTDSDKTNLNINGALTGYRVEYFGLDNDERSEDYTIITSSNKCATIIQNILSTNQKAVRYRFDDASNLLFCTVSPSTSPSYNANTLPYIGRSGEYVRLVNTKFEPVMLEVEMVEHDADTISIMLEGDQIRNLDTDIITTYNENKEIYHQAEFPVIKTETGKPLYETRIKKSSIVPMDYNEIMESAE